jgi:hypothetical protein
MITREISSTYCGREGWMEISGLPDAVPESQLFRYLGYNPWSGNLHYQCPGCRIVLLVKPMEILNESTVNFPRVHSPGQMRRTLTSLLNVVCECALMLIVGR